MSSKLLQAASLRLEQDIATALEEATEAERVACFSRARALGGRIAQALESGAINFSPADAQGLGYPLPLNEPRPENLIHAYQLARQAIFVEARDMLAWRDIHFSIIDQMTMHAIDGVAKSLVAMKAQLRDQLAKKMSRDALGLLNAIATGAELIDLSRDLESAKIFAERLAHNGRRLEKMLDAAALLESTNISLASAPKGIESNGKPSNDIA